MRRLLRAHHDRLALDQGMAERLLTRRLARADAPPAYARVADLLAAASAPPDAEELAGEAAVVAAFAAAVRSRPVRLHTPRRSRVFAKLLTAKAAAVALGVLAAGGVAAAATGTLPAPAQQVAHAVFGSATSTASSATTPTTTAARAHAVGPDAAGPAAQGLCRAWAAGQGGQHGKKLDAVAFAALAKAAGSSGNVAAYCAQVTSSTGGPGQGQGGPPGSLPPASTGGHGQGQGGPPSSLPPASTGGHGQGQGGPPSSLPPASTGGH